MILAALIMNTQGKPRLTKFYEHLVRVHLHSFVCLSEVYLSARKWIEFISFHHHINH